VEDHHGGSGRWPSCIAWASRLGGARVREAAHRHRESGHPAQGLLDAMGALADVLDESSHGRLRCGWGVVHPAVDGRYTPKLTTRTALLRKLKDIFRRFQSQPLDRVVHLINPILRGWVQYFAVGHASRCFSYVRDWVEKKVRRHLMRARKLRGFGWKRWSRRWLYDGPGLFSGYRVHRLSPNVLPTR
jgi:hypothetical protein